MLLFRVASSISNASSFRYGMVLLYVGLVSVVIGEMFFQASISSHLLRNA